MARFDLKKMLDEIVSTYGKNDGYMIPTISWSNENMLSRFGEYQFWNNHIIISNMLQTNKVSENAIKSVIFHEYTHQLYAEHCEAFDARMKLFKGYEMYKKELNEYFNTIEDRPNEQKPDIRLDAGQEMIFCVLPFDQKDPDSYLKNFLYYNHYITGILSNNLPDNFCAQPVKQIVWLIEDSELFYVVGWAKNVELYSQIQKVDLRTSGVSIIQYQFKYRQNEGKNLLPGNALATFYKEEVPASVLKYGVCSSTEIDSRVVDEIVDMINTYNGDFIELGMREDALACIPGIETNDVSKLIIKAKNADSMSRAFLIMNKAVKLEKSYRTYLYRGLAFKDCWVFDNALSDLSEALQFDNITNEEIDKDYIVKKIKQIKRAMTAI